MSDWDLWKAEGRLDAVGPKDPPFQEPLIRRIMQAMREVVQLKEPLTWSSIRVRGVPKDSTEEPTFKIIKSRDTGGLQEHSIKLPPTICPCGIDSRDCTYHKFTVNFEVQNL